MCVCVCVCVVYGQWSALLQASIKAGSGTPHLSAVPTSSVRYQQQNSAHINKILGTACISAVELTSDHSVYREVRPICLSLGSQRLQADVFYVTQLCPCNPCVCTWCMVVMYCGGERVCLEAYGLCPHLSMMHDKQTHTASVAHLYC